MSIESHWVTLRYANGIVNAWHTHLPPARAHIFALGAFDGAECVGVVICGRPIARRQDDGHTLEVSRLATNGYPNAASTLLGRARRVASAMGFLRLVSYTLESEDGTSYRAAGWTATGPTRWASWRVRPGRADRLAHQTKMRWEASAK